ncbi:esterase/lipase family protein [Chromobacterium violaceum]|uniref:DUF7379 domain-containing protein n=1 Tax=Chromobacterium violaceum (strain ATCC 12472 / DSM 30191 / JCM 1249 / CCUG 213 / NBRC 12614 / NCIMB 9131 / NCTC 9757 / MK) TaxID=243365 RepID=Q7NUY6_CHRVO|nr:hypothetical protein [Chromobacterium violaceum]AAQ60231.1 hypothetical protein CV_2561 [Chromobacterium violaceum ATCC 12472]SUX35759.1 Uncharacterised protein [Chromobacterium violaceum]
MAKLAENQSVDKSEELQKALQQARFKGEFLGGGFSLVPATHPLTQEFGLRIATAEQSIGEANLLIVQHADTKAVQFIFPAQSRQPIYQEQAVHDFSFIQFRQLGPTIADATKWLVQGALKVPQNLATDAVWAAARAIEIADKTEGFIALADGYVQLATPERLAQARGKRVLLFVHGIFSSIKGAFDSLGSSSQATTMQALVNAYHGNVFGYDHWTISKTPLENALDLLDKIPVGANWSVDLVCHSRGGLIARSLFADPSPNALLKNATLKGILARREGKIGAVGKVFFVAAANQGSQLANPDDICNFLNMAALLASKSRCFSLDVVIGLARLLVSAAFDLPSIQELSTTSSLVSDLNEIGSLMSDQNVYGARADFDCARSVLLEAGVLLDKLLMQVDNDLVVPYQGVASPNPNIPNARLLAFGNPDAKQGTVWHTEFFAQPEMHKFLLDNLTRA